MDIHSLSTGYPQLISHHPALSSRRGNVCSKLWAGEHRTDMDHPHLLSGQAIATADVTTLLPVIDRLRQRFGIDRVCIVADRGMISDAAIAGLEERQLEYILGARERGDVLVKKIVMENDDPFVPLLIERQTGETQLFVKQVMLEDSATLSAATRRKPRTTVKTASGSSPPSIRN